MRILWICNIMLPVVAEYLGKEVSNKEGWLTGLADMILKNKEDNQIELAVAFPVEEALPKKRMEIPVSKWNSSLICYGFAEDTNHPEIYSQETEVQLGEILEDWKPGVVHCFGTEYPHTLAITRVYPKEKILIGIQGMCKLIAESYLADLPQRVIRRVTFRDWLKKDSITRQQEKFFQRSKHEIEALQNTGHVTGRTWMDKKFVADINSPAKYHVMNEALRSNFYEGCWVQESCEKYSIFLSQGDYPLKGLHYMLLAMPEILKKYPEAKVYVAGNSIANYRTLKDKIKISSYGKYILELIQKYQLENKVSFLGKLNAEQMKEQFLKSNVFVCTSTMENSPNSLGEAMLLGVPCISAEVGGVRSVFDGEKDGILYPGYGAAEYKQAPDKEAAQAKVLAEAVIRMWSQEEGMSVYGKSAAEHARKTHNSQNIYDRLVEIYKEIARV